MKFEAKTSKQSRPYWHVVLIFLTFPIFSYLIRGEIELTDLTPIVVAAITWLIFSYIANNQYSVISIIHGNVSFGSRGMVHGNFKTKDVIEVNLNAESDNPSITVVTSDDCRFAIPIAGFNENEVDQIIRSIKT